MVGGYVLVAVPAVLLDPDFKSGTVVPGLYETVSVAFSTGKIPVCQFDSGVTGSPFAGVFLKMPDSSFFITVNNKDFFVNPDDTVAIK